VLPVVDVPPLEPLLALVAPVVDPLALAEALVVVPVEVVPLAPAPPLLELEPAFEPPEQPARISAASAAKSVRFMRPPKRARIVRAGRFGESAGPARSFVYKIVASEGSI
jgi:hypothetical protein